MSKRLDRCHFSKPTGSSTHTEAFARWTAVGSQPEGIVGFFLRKAAAISQWFWTSLQSGCALPLWFCSTQTHTNYSIYIVQYLMTVWLQPKHLQLKVSFFSCFLCFFITVQV